MDIMTLLCIFGFVVCFFSCLALSIKFDVFMRNSGASFLQTTSILRADVIEFYAHFLLLLYFLFKIVGVSIFISFGTLVASTVLITWTAWERRNELSPVEKLIHILPVISLFFFFH